MKTFVIYKSNCPSILNCGYDIRAILQTTFLWNDCRPEQPKIPHPHILFGSDYRNLNLQRCQLLRLKLYDIRIIKFWSQQNLDMRPRHLCDGIPYLSRQQSTRQPHKP